jgi:hypothetical protein
MAQRITEEQLAQLDPVQLLTDADGRLFGAGAVAAALRAHAVGAQPRALAFLGQIVYSGGLAFALGLPELMPTPQQSDLVRQWLAAVDQAHPAADAARDERLARWLTAVASVLALRVATEVPSGRSPSS